MGLFSKNNDEQFYNQRADDVQNSVDTGDMDAAARLVAHLIVEEGAGGLEKLTAAVERKR